MRRVIHHPCPQSGGKAPHRAARQRATRPKTAKLAVCDRLRGFVQQRLEKNHSPEQISHCLIREFPEDAEMRVSHETIYLSLYIQSRGALERELKQHLRTKRTLRASRRRPDERRGRIPEMVHISQRPAEADDRAVPGHWESQCCCQAAGTSSTGSGS
ncbi:IS30 family transposase [Rhodococcus sp. 14C212]|nr:IS30 family transposase [Rhodococcus sp. 14C212]